MNKIFLFCLAGITASLLSSCAGFLDENPRSSLPAETFFSDPRTVQAAVNALYKYGVNNTAFISPGVYNGCRSMQGGWGSGLFDNLNYKGQEAFIQYAQEFTMTSNNMNVRMGDMFNEPYQAIGRANLIIATVPTLDLVTAGITETQAATYVAEAKFFRAQNYLWLVKHFGDLPLVTVPQTAADDLNLPRTDAKIIYETVIIPDLQEAVRVLPVQWQYSNSMRITATIASAYLIDAYIQMSGHPVNVAKWTEAAAEAKKFLPGGAYASLFAFETNEDFEELSAYNKLRSVNVHTPSPGGRKLANSREYIHVQEFTAGITNAGFSANAWPLEVGALGSAECRVTLTNNAYKPMPRYLAMYDPAKDLRMKERQFFVNSFDLRNGESMVNWPENNKPSPYFYYDWGAVKVENTSGRHFASKRLPEMYLFAAEAIARSEGVTAQAVDALATIRARAYEFGGITKESIAAELSALPVNKFVEEVWLETYREFVFEFKQWNLIQRTRLYPKTNAMDSSIPVGTAQFVDFTSVGTDFSGGKTFSINYLLWPMPQDQLQRNPNLTNNPGY